MEPQQLKRYIMQDVLEPQAESGFPHYTQILDKIEKKWGKQTLAKYLGPEAVNNLYDFSKAIKMLTEKQGKGIGGMAVQLKTGSNIASIPAAVMSGNLGAAVTKVGGATVFLLTPEWLGRQMINPKSFSRKYLPMIIKGMTTPAKSKEANSLLARLATMEMTEEEGEQQ